MGLLSQRSGDIALLMERGESTKVHRLRARAERALEEGRRREEVLPLLERLVREATDNSEHQLFARRRLAEIYLEHHPWRAALHARRLVKSNCADDGAYALMGLAQTLLGNFNTAIAAYRQALAMAPDNPWYHHNLGHLLDVCKGDTVGALAHLRAAHRIKSEEDEITASLAHCLARVGELAEAKSLAENAAARAPRNEDHQALLAWVEKGAPNEKGPRSSSIPDR
jgi:Flp pilus assembly protein TadD